ncbi:MAG: PGDYG domain-containing protein [Acidimicrobiales bacterium]
MTRRPVVVSVVFAGSDGMLETLEGPVPYARGDAVVTGVGRERWPIPREAFFERYESQPPTVSGADGRYVSRPNTLFAVQLTDDEAGSPVTTTSGGVLVGKAGDWLVQYAAGDFGVVDQQIFADTYDEVA